MPTIPMKGLSGPHRRLAYPTPKRPRQITYFTYGDGHRTRSVLCRKCHIPLGGARSATRYWESRRALLNCGARVTGGSRREGMSKGMVISGAHQTNLWRLVSSYPSHMYITTVKPQREITWRSLTPSHTFTPNRPGL